MRRTLARRFGVAATLSAVGVAGFAGFAGFAGAAGAAGASPAGASPPAVATRFTTMPGPPLTMSCQVVTLDLSAGTVEPLGPLLESERCPVDYAARADGRIYGVTLTGLTTQDPSPLVLVEPTTGEQTVVGSTEVHVTDIGGLEFDAAGTLWFAGKTTEHGCDQGHPCLYRVDADTAAATFVGQLVSLTTGFIGGLTRTCVDPLYTNLIETEPMPADASVSSPLTGLTFGSLDCTVEAVVLAPRFTG